MVNASIDENDLYSFETFNDLKGNIEEIDNNQEIGINRPESEKNSSNLYQDALEEKTDVEKLVDFDEEKDIIASDVVEENIEDEKQLDPPNKADPIDILENTKKKKPQNKIEPLPPLSKANEKMKPSEISASTINSKQLISTEANSGISAINKISVLNFSENRNIVLLRI